MKYFSHHTAINLPALTLASFLLFALLIFTAPAFSQGQDSDYASDHAPNSKEKPDKGYTEIPDEYLDEAQNFFLYCENKTLLREYHDCECLASRYLDQRIKRGGTADRSHIMLSIRNTCHEASEAAGAEYNSCMGSTTSIPIKVEPKVFCECYANTYAKLFEEYGASVSSKTIVKLRTRSRVTCLNPKLGQKLYR